MVNEIEFKVMLYRKGLQQKDIANLLGISYSALHSKKTNKSEFSVSQILKIQQFCELTKEERLNIFGI